MSIDPLQELLQFLKPESRIDLKHISLDHLVGLSGSEEGINTLLKNEQIIQSIIDLTDDRVDEIAKCALLALVNITAYPKGATEILKYKPNGYKNIIEIFIGYVLNPQKSNADAVCMILSNITRLEDELEVCLDTFIPHLNDILNVFVNIDFNKKGSKLHYLAPMICNLSRSQRIRKWLTEENPHVPLIKLLPFCSYEESNIRRGGAIGTIRNLSFDTEFHEFLLRPDLDLLTYLLGPLMGNDDYEDEEMDKLPITLQYLPKEKKREVDPDIRKMILETLNQFCTKRKFREILRENGAYYVLREYHKWEKDPQALLACENVVDILIQKEEEVGTEDFSTVQVPEDLKAKFVKMDEEYVNTAKYDGTTLLNNLNQEPSGQFDYFCRMSSIDFEYLLQLIVPRIKKQDTVFRESIPAKVHLAVTLRFLATGDSFKSLHYLFKISPQVISLIVPEVCKALCEALRSFVKMPQSEQGWLEVARDFETKWQFPHCLGAIDGKHIKIASPINSGSEFYNYKHNFSII